MWKVRFSGRSVTKSFIYFELEITFFFFQKGNWVSFFIPSGASCWNSTSPDVTLLQDPPALGQDGEGSKDSGLSLHTHCDMGLCFLGLVDVSSVALWIIPSWVSWELPCFCLTDTMLYTQVHSGESLFLFHAAFAPVRLPLHRVRMLRPLSYQEPPSVWPWNPSTHCLASQTHGLETQPGWLPLHPPHPIIDAIVVSCLFMFLCGSKLLVHLARSTTELACHVLCLLWVLSHRFWARDNLFSESEEWTHSVRKHFLK